MTTASLIQLFITLRARVQADLEQVRFQKSQFSRPSLAQDIFSDLEDAYKKTRVALTCALTDLGYQDLPEETIEKIVRDIRKQELDNAHN